MKKRLLILLLSSLSLLGQSTTVNVKKTDGTLFTGALDANVYPNITQYATDELDATIAAKNPTSGRWLEINEFSTSRVSWFFNPTEGGPDISGQRIRPTGYVTGSWIRNVAWSAAKNASSLKGMVFDSTGNVVQSTATKQQVDKTAMQVATVADMRALDPAQLNNGQLIQTGGRNANGDGGGLLFRYVAGDTTATNLGTVFAFTSGTGRMIWIGGTSLRVEVWGAVGDWNDSTRTGTDNSTSLAAFITYLNTEAKNSIAPVEMLFGSGDYATSTGLTPTRNGVKIRGQSPQNGIVVRGTSLVIIGTNTPGVTLNGYDQELRDIGIKYTYRQPSTATESKAIVIGPNGFKALIDNVSTKYGAYGLYCNDPSVSQVRINKLWVQNYSISGYAALNQGTTWTVTDAYIQNLDPDDTTDTHKTITGVSLSGTTNITFTCAGGLPPLLNTNRLFTVTGMDPGYNAGYIALTISGNSVTCSSVTALSAPVITNGGSLIFFARPATGVPFISQYGNTAIKGLDIEHCVTDQPYGAQFGSAQANQIDDIYIEHIYSASGPMSYVRNIYGPLTIDSLTVVNGGVNPGSTNWFVANTSGESALISVQHASARDIARTGGGALYVGNVISPATSNPRIGTIGASVSARANASGVYDRLGNATLSFGWTPMLNASGGTETVASIAYDINQSGGAGYYGLRLSATYNTTGSGSKYPFAFTRGGIDYFRFNDSGVTEIGDPAGTAGTVLTMYGNSGGVNLMRLVRTGSLDFGIGLSSGIRFVNNSTATASLTSFVDAGAAYLYIGSVTIAAPKTGQIKAESATGTDVSGAALSLDAGAGTGNAINNSFIQFRTSTAGVSGASAQSLATRAAVFTSGMVVDTSGSLSVPNASSVFDVRSTTRGSLPTPVMTEAQRDAISSPANLLQVGNSTTVKQNIYNGSRWYAQAQELPTVSTSWILAALTALTPVTTTVTVTGAQVGDQALVAPSVLNGGNTIVAAVVTSADTVTLYANALVTTVAGQTNTVYVKVIAQ
jgi:hypothetical protein